MEIEIIDTRLRCHEDGRIERFDKRCNLWKLVKDCISHGYLQIGIDGKRFRIHRLIYKAFHPEWDLDSPLYIDHINRVKTDNRLENLRVVTNQQNQFNTIPKKGYCRYRNGFRANIQVNDKQLTKQFATEDEARQWYLEQKAIHHIIDLPR